MIRGIKVIAEKQIKEEFREGYVSTFTPEHFSQDDGWIEAKAQELSQALRVACTKGKNGYTMY